MQQENKEKILIIEDDIQLTFFISSTLERENYVVKAIHSGKEGLQEILNNNYSLILLDIDLPELDGLNVCKEIRKTSDIPIIFFTGQNLVHQKVRGLDAGANDYISKPVEVPELLARVRAHLRIRSNITDNLAHKSNEYRFNDISIDLNTRQVLINNSNIHLSPKEFDILLYFMKNPNKLLTKQQIFEEVWKTSFNNSSDKKVVDEHFNKLRNKIHTNQKTKLLHTVYGVGHILK